eukprot:scaffold26094_cov100-Isochrysis_galbana.AAC.1
MFPPTPSPPRRLLWLASGEGARPEAAPASGIRWPAATRTGGPPKPAWSRLRQWGTGIPGSRVRPTQKSGGGWGDRRVGVRGVVWKWVGRKGWVRCGGRAGGYGIEWWDGREDEAQARERRRRERRWRESGSADGRRQPSASLAKRSPSANSRWLGCKSARAPALP